MTAPIQSRPDCAAAPGMQAGPSKAPAGSASFGQALEQAQDLRFSNHALKRLEKREIALNDDGLSRLATAVEKANQRGGRESLVLMDDLAFIVNVKERLVVTALDARKRGEGVFTQIDSVVFADPQGPQGNG